MTVLMTAKPTVYQRGESPAHQRMQQYILTLAGSGEQFQMSIWAASRVAGVSRNTAQKVVLHMLASGLLSDLTPELTNQAHTYRLNRDRLRGVSVSGHPQEPDSTP